MAPTSKKSKTKSRGTQNDSQSQEEEPDLDNLSQEIEKRARKSKKMREMVSEETPLAGTSSDSTPSIVLSAPESLPKDLIQEMRFEIESMKKQNREQQAEMVFLKSKVVAKDAVDYQWKKEGNRKQYELIHRFIGQVNQAKDKYRYNGLQKGDQELDLLVANMNERIKMLRIADTSPHGWQTVQEYEVNPIAKDDADDQKLRRAERAAQEKIAQRNQERRNKQGRFQPYGGQGNNRPHYSSYNNEGAAQGSQGYRSYGGFKSQNSFKTSTVVQDKQTPKRNINNDICFQCGSRGHWANHCPERKQMEDTDE